MADCRKCIYFVPYDALDPETLEKALVWIAKHRPGAELKGWCRYYGQPVTYYTGRCKAYTPKRPRPVATLERFLGGAGDA